MILKITKRTTLNDNIIKTFEPVIIECNQVELDIDVIPKLKQLVAVNNLHYSLIGSDNKCEYHIDGAVVLDINTFIARANRSIDNAIKTYNSLVDGVNVDIKRCNKKNNRPVNTGVLNNVEEKMVKIGAKGITTTALGTGLLIR